MILVPGILTSKNIVQTFAILSMNLRVLTLLDTEEFNILYGQHWTSNAMDCWEMFSDVLRIFMLFVVHHLHVSISQQARVIKAT